MVMIATQVGKVEAHREVGEGLREAFEFVERTHHIGDCRQHRTRPFEHRAVAVEPGQRQQCGALRFRHVGKEIGQRGHVLVCSMS